MLAVCKLCCGWFLNEAMAQFESICKRSARYGFLETAMIRIHCSKCEKPILVEKPTKEPLCYYCWDSGSQGIYSK